jgi:hypothetical protein
MRIAPPSDRSVHAERTRPRGPIAVAGRARSRGASPDRWTPGSTRVGYMCAPSPPQRAGPLPPSAPSHATAPSAPCSVAALHGRRRRTAPPLAPTAVPPSRYPPDHLCANRTAATRLWPGGSPEQPLQRQSPRCAAAHPCRRPPRPETTRKWVLGDPLTLLRPFPGQNPRRPRRNFKARAARPPRGPHCEHRVLLRGQIAKG